MFIHPQSEFVREPGLFEPWKKPVGPVKIDWTNQMAKGLSIALVPNKVSYDLVSGTRTENENELKIDSYRGIFGVKSRRAYDSDTTVRQQANDDYSFFSPGFPSTVTAAIMVEDTPGASDTFIAVLPTALKCSCSIDSVDTSKFKFFVNNRSYYHSKQLSKGDYVTITITMNSAGASRCYVDGSYVGSPNTFNYVSEVTGFNLISGDNASGDFPGILVHFYAMKRALSDDEIFRLYKDPYQFIIPA